MNRYHNQGITLKGVEQNKAAISGILLAGVIVLGLKVLFYTLTII